MPELIRRGHVYIAQPPLYKVKRGKQEQYVKDDAELNGHLLQLSLNDARLHVAEDAPAISDDSLANMAQSYMRVVDRFDQMERYVGRNILRELIDITPVRNADLDDEGKLQQFGRQLAEQLNRDLDETSHYHSSTVKTDDGIAIELKRRIHGNDQVSRVDPAFLRSAEYQMIADFAAETDGLLQEGATIRRGEREHPVTAFSDVMDWLLNESRRGLTIQRYKGLGEMNPDQLWETTMDPNTRRMLQVTIEDAMAADEVFDTLMGDQVEPRREFIQRNALSVANLDV